MKAINKIILAFVVSVLLMLTGCQSPVAVEQKEMNETPSEVEVTKKNEGGNDDKIEERTKSQKSPGGKEVKKKEEGGKNKEKETKKKNKKSERVEKKKTFQSEMAKGEFMATQPLNMRDGPGMDYKIVGYAQPGQRLTASKKSKSGSTTWLKVKNHSNEITAWVGSGYTTKYDPDYTQKQQVKNKVSSGSSPSSGSGKAKASSNKEVSEKKYKPNHIYYSGKAVPYKNVGMKGNQAQDVIDTSNYAATFGGATTFSGTDGMNTHFVGHNRGRNQFGGMHKASEFVVTDSQGNAFTYVKTRMYVVDEYGRDSGGNEYLSRIVGTGGGERITLQSIKNHPWKYIVEAELK